MKMADRRHLKVTVSRKTPCEVEVALPFYRYSSFDGDDGDYRVEHWTRVSADPGAPATELTLTHTVAGGGREEWNVAACPFYSRGDDADYVLGRGGYALTADVWEAQRLAFLRWLRDRGVLRDGDWVQVPR